MSARVTKPTQPTPGTHRGAITNAFETAGPIPSRRIATDVSKAESEDTCLYGMVYIEDIEGGGTERRHRFGGGG